ncbi:MAG TPA: hypothetical protein VGE45_00465 [Chloroflexia bacterium]|jgi:hypothetical protein
MPNIHIVLEAFVESDTLKPKVQIRWGENDIDRWTPEEARRLAGKILMVAAQAETDADFFGMIAAANQGDVSGAAFMIQGMRAYRADPKLRKKAMHAVRVYQQSKKNGKAHPKLVGEPVSGDISGLDKGEEESDGKEVE